MTKARVSSADAKAVLRAVEAKFAAYIEGTNGPSLIRDWDWIDAKGIYAIVWEGGPYDWAIDFASSAHIDETASETADIQIEYPAHISIPPTVSIEPQYSWALGIFPAFGADETGGGRS
jgi:hypothetical protein